MLREEERYIDVASKSVYTGSMAVMAGRAEKFGNAKNGTDSSGLLVPGVPGDVEGMRDMEEMTLDRGEYRDVDGSGIRVLSSDRGSWIGTVFAFLTLFFVFLAVCPNCYHPDQIKVLLCVIGVSLTAGATFLVPSSFRTIWANRGVLVPFLLYWAVVFLSFDRSTYPRLSLLQQSEDVMVLLLFLVIMSREITDRFLEFVCRFLVVVTGLASLYAIVQVLGFDPVSWVGFDGRVFSTFGHPNIFGSFLIFTLPLLGMWLSVADRRIDQISVTLVIFGSTLSLILTRSRSAWVALAIVLLVVFSASLRRGRISQGRRRLLLVILIVCLVAAIMVLLVDAVNERATTLVRLSDPGVMSRLMIYRSIIPAVADKPILGWGRGSFSGVFPLFHQEELYSIPPFNQMRILKHAHSEYLEAAVETGLVGLILFGLCCMTAVFTARRRIILEEQGGNQTVVAILNGVIIGLAAILIQALVSVSLQFLTTRLLFWTALGICAAAGRQGNGEESLDRSRWRSLLFGVIITAMVVLSAIKLVPREYAAFRASRLLLQADHDLQRGETRSAKQHLEKAFSVNPLSMDALNMLGEARYRDNDLVGATEAFAAVLQINPHYPLVHYHLALMAFLRHDLDAARFLLVDAARWRPLSWQILTLRGEIAMEQNNFYDAEALFLRATALEPSALEPQIGLGNAAAKRGDRNRSFSWFARALMINPNNRQALQRVAEENYLLHQNVRMKKVKALMEANPKAVPVVIVKECAQQTEADAITPPLRSVSLSQTFLNHCPTLSTFSFKIATRGRTVTFQLDYILLEQQVIETETIEQEIRRGSISYNQVSDNEWLDVAFPPVENAVDHRFRIVLKRADVQESDFDTGTASVHLWLKLRDLYPNGEVWYNDFSPWSDLQFVAH